MVPTLDGPDSPRSVEEFRLMPGAARAIRMLNDLGLPVILVSNQPGVAKGKFSVGDLDAMTGRMKADLGEARAVIDGIYYCMHHPQAIDGNYRTECDCRKPGSGLLTIAASEMALDLHGSYMVGDQCRDIVAGRNVGCTTVLVGSDAPTSIGDEADHMRKDLEAAAELITELEGASLTSR
jgi:D-glycero-D-manno-heptose 1,7-bisphosphate phosphatase